MVHVFQKCKMSVKSSKDQAGLSGICSMIWDEVMLGSAADVWESPSRTPSFFLLDHAGSMS